MAMQIEHFQIKPCLTVDTIIGNQALVKEDSFTLKKIISDISELEMKCTKKKYNLKACTKMAFDTNYSLMGNLR